MLRKNDLKLRGEKHARTLKKLKGCEQIKIFVVKYYDGVKILNGIREKQNNKKITIKSIAIIVYNINTFLFYTNNSAVFLINKFQILKQHLKSFINFRSNHLKT